MQEAHKVQKIEYVDLFCTSNAKETLMINLRA